MAQGNKSGPGSGKTLGLHGAARMSGSKGAFKSHSGKSAIPSAGKSNAKHNVFKGKTGKKDNNIESTW